MITTQDIEGLFSDFLSLIEASRLREQVVAAWVTGCAEGGWESVDQLERMPFTLLTDTHGISFLEHTRAVTAGAVALARAQLDHCRSLPYEVNFDYLVAGGLLHDVGKLVEIEPDGAGGFRKSHAGRCARHPIGGTVLAAQAGVPPDILNIVACHSREGDGRPKRVETILVKQADFATFDPLTMLNQGTLILPDED